MALLKLHRINRAGEIIINTDQILFVEIESRTTTVNMVGGLLFSVEESPDWIVDQLAKTATEIRPSSDSLPSTGLG